MKFIKNAPDIPLELLQAQEDGKLVFFCGAGISYPAGLPLFKGLVDGVYEELATDPTPQEKQAIEQWRYDTALELLERRYHANNRADKYAVKRAITNRLTFKPDANFDTHKALLQLAKTKNNQYRLVTTNVDDGFIQANPESIKFSDTAPKLPIPKPNKWHSIVYLHGLINKDTDPNYENLIFTSGDFGTAYLTERWASRFVSELFRHFTVLFIGYSIDDPVMRYMTDAIAADRRRGYHDFKEPYVLAGTKISNFESAKLDWQAKGVIPILYDDRNKHTYLHKTLKAWASYCQDDLKSIERDIKTYALKPPIEPYEHDYGVQKVVAHLKNDEYAAKVFSQLNAPIAWLPVLEKEGLLSKIENPKNRQITHHINTDIITPHQITRHLWWWLIDYHLESKELVAWAIEKQVLHPLFIAFLEGALFRKPPAEPFLTFWRIWVLNLNSYTSRQDSFHQIHNIEKCRDGLNLLSLLNLLKPKIKFSKPFVFGDEEPACPYKAEVKISVGDWEFHHIIKYVNEMTGLLLPVTNLLKQAMEFWQLLGQADEKHDKSHWGLPSISPHHQNHRYDNWLLLIELCRDLWQATYQSNSALALAVIEIWKTIPFPVFKRLVFHAYTISDIASPTDKLNYLLTDNNWWLWSVITQRETFRLLAALCPQLTPTDLITLEQAIISGTPREMYRDDLSNEDWQRTNDRQIWLHLAKLESFGMSLTEQTKAIYQQLSEKYPNWQLQEDEQDEFSHWVSGVTAGRQTSLIMEDFIKSTPEQQIEALLTPPYNDPFERNQTSFFNSVCQSHPSIGLDTLKYMAGQSNWNAEIWHAGLMGFSETKVQWSEVAKLVVQFPNELFEKQAWVIAWWINKTISSVEANNADEQYFWRIFDLLSSQITERDTKSDDIINHAINTPIGILTEALLNRFSVRKINNMEKINETNLLNCINKLMNGDDAVFLPAKVILISRLHYFYAIDPDWTNANLMPLLNWKKSTNAALYWQGFIWNARVSNELALIIKNDFLDTLLEHSHELNKDYLDNMIQLFADICFAYQDLYSTKEQRQVLNSIGVEGLIKVSEFMFRVMGNSTKENDQYWKKRIKPFFKNAWSKDAQYLHSNISENLALMCLRLDEEFEDAVATVENILIPFKEVSLFLHELKESEHIQKYPKTTFKLLADIFDENLEYWSINEFKEIVDSLITAEPSLKNNPKYQEMNQFLIRASN